MQTSKKIITSTMVAGALVMQTTTGNGQGTVSVDASSDEAIHPFHFHASQADLDDLRRRILATKWPDKETVTDFSQGVPNATIQALAKYWSNNYDWRKIETKINSYPNFITKIDGLNIHFIHVRSKHKNALPIIITHGWPGSVIEQLKIIGPLTDPTAYGGKAEDAFDVVIPSMPGYGFSQKPTNTGWGPQRIANAWIALMKRLGYNKFVAQGGDWGAVITDFMAVQSPENLLAIHVNMPGAIPANVDAAAFSGAPAPSGLSDEEKRSFDELSFFYKHVYYAFEMGTRPQTLVGLADSPVGLASFLIDHDARSLELISRSFAGKSEGLTRDDVLDNITLFWLTNTGISSSRLYWENKSAFFSPKGVTVPVAVSVFPDELYYTPRNWAEKAYPNLVYYNNKHDKGGHFAAWEQPEALVKDIREGFKSLR